MTDSVLNILKIALLALLYLFFGRVLWAVWSEVRGPRPTGHAPVPTSAKARAKAAVGAANNGPGANDAASNHAASNQAASTSAASANQAAANQAAPQPQPRKQSAPAQMKAKSKPKAGKKGLVARLIVLEPRVRKGTAIGLAHEVTFGRAAGCTVSVPDDNYVSQVHARVYRSGEAVIIEDLDSTNGTYVNGSRITGSITLRPGDRVQFGTTVLEAS